MALGDSFTEGLCDPPVTPGSRWRGWADRLAEDLSTRSAADGLSFDYANLAVRGKLLPQIIEEQLDVALAMDPDLVSLVGGGNDVMRPRADVDELSRQLESALIRLREAGCTVVLGTAYDAKTALLVRITRGRAAEFTANIWSMAARHGAFVLDLWGARTLYHPSLWAPDRIHLTAQGHERVAHQMVSVLGLSEDRTSWDAPLPPPPPRSRIRALREDTVWLREHALPWVGRRLRGRSSGDGLPPKRPDPEPVLPLSPSPSDLG